MKRTHDLGSLDWRLSGWTPYLWRFEHAMETGTALPSEEPPIPARVPGSVQGALRDAGLLPDWNVGLSFRACEWVENRHWIYEADIPDEWLSAGGRTTLRALGLDYRGWVYLNGREAGAFQGSFTPHAFDLTPLVKPSGNRLHIVFDCPPRWLGQIGYTSQMTEWKPRFNYTWDWTARLVQAGIWDDVAIETADGPVLDDPLVLADIDTSGTARLVVRAAVPDGHELRVLVSSGGRPLLEARVSASEASAGHALAGLPIEPWWPNGHGRQPLYDVDVSLVDPGGQTLDTVRRRVGFKSVSWRACEGAPDGADPWICVVNGRPVFLQGVNWTPIRPNFADVADEEYRERLTLYRDLGMNLLRVWGGAFLEKAVFYDLCDELGLMVWQEFPLSSSGLDNWPPEEPCAIEEMAAIATSYVRRRRHHASLLCWCGGNELQCGLDGRRQGIGAPCGLSHPMLARLARVVGEEDPGRRFLPASSGGPRFCADEADFGKGLHWDVHGPWNAAGALAETWDPYWARDDALFRSETGMPGASPADIIEAYRGELDAMPGTVDNGLWRRSSWWIDWPQFVAEHRREPETLEEFVDWSQARQADALRTAALACKRRFPRCGGILIWMGHDSYPCTANTSIVDYWGRPKPAALALGEVFRG